MGKWHQYDCCGRHGLCVPRTTAATILIVVKDISQLITVTSWWARWRLRSPVSDCLFNRLFRCRSSKISKLRVTGLCAGNSPVTSEFPTQMASNTEYVSIWWRHPASVPSDRNIYAVYILCYLSTILDSKGWYELVLVRSTCKIHMADAKWSGTMTVMTVMLQFTVDSHNHIWVRSRNCGCLVTWFCYQLITKSGNNTAAVPWPDPYSLHRVFNGTCAIEILAQNQSNNPAEYEWIG